MKNFIENKDYQSLLGTSPFVPFDIFWIKRNGKKVLIKSQGGFSQREDLEKWNNPNLTLDYKSELNEAWLEKGFELLEEFGMLCASEVPGPWKISKWRLRFLSWLHPSFWDDQELVSLLDICFLIGSAFYELEGEAENVFLSFPLELQKKNYASASLTVLLGIVIGYTSWSFLRDVFVICLFRDYPFALEMWSERERNYLTQEWNVPGLGESLSKGMKTHILKKYGAYKKEGERIISQEIENTGLSKYLLWSFERVNGEGFPYHYLAHELSDLDLMMVFTYHSFDFDVEISGERKANILKKFLDAGVDFKKANMAKRLEALIVGAFSKAEKKKQGYLEIVGL